MNTESHKSSLLLCLSEVIMNQWIQLEEKFFSDLNIVIAYSDKALKGFMQLKLNWISSQTVRNDSLDLITWLIQSRFMWNQSELKASKTVLLTSYDIWHSQTLKSESKMITNKKGVQVEEIVYAFNWTDRFFLVLMNEKHWLQNMKIKAHLTVKLLDCEYHWFLTVTSSINNLSVS